MSIILQYKALLVYMIGYYLEPMDEHQILEYFLVRGTLFFEQICLW